MSVRSITPLRSSVPSRQPAPKPTAGPAPAKATPAPGKGIVLPDVSAAVDWKPGSTGLSGTAANLQVTNAYEQIDQAFSQYLGSPALPNWTTFGKYASDQVGEQIDRMESMLYNLHHASPNAWFNQIEDFVAHPASLGEQGLALMQVSKTPEALLSNVQKMRNALVYGNTHVFANIAPAFTTYLRAENQGQDGLAALRAAGYGRAPLDPQNFLLQAFTNYQQAHAIGQKLSRGGLSAAEQKQLLAQRQKLVNQGNLLVGIQEQMVILQRPEVFGDPTVSRIVAATTPKMTLPDAVQTMKLLPNGGNWANFADRMGFVEVPRGSDPQAITVTDPSGVAHDYVPNPDTAKRQGTIYQYFLDNLPTARAQKMISGTPQPLSASFADPNSGLSAIARWWHDATGWVGGLFHHDKTATA